MYASTTVSCITRLEMSTYMKEQTVTREGLDTALGLEVIFAYI